MMAWKISPALAAGCTILLKPSEHTPLTALHLAQLSIEAGFPPGVFNVLPGDGATGSAIAKHEDVNKVAFTGSTVTGKKVWAMCGEGLKRCALELGGKVS
jgi:acyl-CoA reductase-like NAD-dependent aldehyde dehydrogenase